MTMAVQKKAADASERAQPARSSILPVDESPVPELGKDLELKAFREMLLIRRFEEKAGQLYGMGLIGGFCHLYIGQEAVVVGMQLAMREGRMDAADAAFSDAARGFQQLGMAWHRAQADQLAVQGRTERVVLN